MGSEMCIRDSVRRTHGDPLPEFGPDLTSGVVSIDDASFTTRVGLHSGSCAIRQLMALAPPDSGSPQTFISASCWQEMLRTGAADDRCVSSVPPRTFGGFGSDATLRCYAGGSIECSVFR